MKQKKNNTIDSVIKKLKFDNILFESDIIELLKKKHINLYNDLVFLKTPMYIKVKDLNYNYKVNNLYTQCINYSKELKKNSEIIEPIFIKNNELLSKYYNYLNVKFTILNNYISNDDNIYKILSLEENKILKIRLKNE